jgi:hypothetical protein
VVEALSTGNPQRIGATEGGVFSRLPLLPDEREYGALSAHGTCFAYAIATWCFLVGSYAADLVGAVEGTICLIAGNVIGVFLTGMPREKLGSEDFDGSERQEIVRQQLVTKEDGWLLRFVWGQ